jgi:hypothetical protein
VPIRMNTGVQLNILESQSGYNEPEDLLLQLLEPQALLVYRSGVLVDKATAAKGLAKLERRGYLRRIPDQNDRRIRRLYLSEAGQAVMPQIEATLRRVTEVCSTDLLAGELEELFGLLDKVEASLGHYIEGKS